MGPDLSPMLCRGEAYWSGTDRTYWYRAKVRGGCRGSWGGINFWGVRRLEEGGCRDMRLQVAEVAWRGEWGRGVQGSLMLLGEWGTDAMEE